MDNQHLVISNKTCKFNKWVIKIRKKTDKQFKEDIKRIYNNDVSVIGKYIRNVDPIEIKCNKCGNTDIITGKQLMKGKFKCKHCNSGLYPLTLDNLDGEIWKDIRGFEGIYQVSNKARVKRLKRMTSNNIPLPEMIMKFRVKDDGYVYGRLELNGKRCNKSMHRLVAEAFVCNENPDKYKEVNHIDGNKTNNLPENLEWTDRQGNIKHGFEHNLYNNERVQKLCINNNKRFENGYSLIDPETGEVVKTGTLLEVSLFTGLTSRAINHKNKLNKKIIYRGYYWVTNN